MRRPFTTCAHRNLIMRFSLTLCLLFATTSLFAGDHTGRKNEFKLMVTSVDATTALKSLGLDRSDARKGTVYFFDTHDKMLHAQHVTLRARQPVNQSGDTTVKLRAVPGAIALSDGERALPIENDWTNARSPAEARSLTREDIEQNLVASVGTGLKPVAELFTDAQRRLVEARVPAVAWEELKRFGPIEAYVWKKKTLTGFKEPLTVELWRLQQGGRTLELLEVSAKARAETDADAQELARQFFAAAEAAGLGDPTNETKTQQVMEFFK